MKIASAWSGHDCSFCILDNGRPVIHAEYERYIREKEPAGDGVQFMFDEYADHSDIKHFATNHSFSKLQDHPESLSKLQNIIQNNGGEIHVVGHHEAHAANAFFSSNFKDSLIFTMDGGGFETPDRFITAFTIWRGKDNKIVPIHIAPISNINIGGVWTRVTRYVFGLQSGWPRGHQAGTVMAMAALGDPNRFYQDFYKMLTTDSMAVSFKPAGQPRGANVGTDPVHPYLGKWTEIANEGEQNKFDLAAGLQAATEDYMKRLLGTFIEKNSDTSNICFAGGVSLNSVVMGKMMDWFPDKNLYVTPTPHDGGLTLGAAQLVWHQRLDNPRIIWEDNYTPYLGANHVDLIEPTIEKFKDTVVSRQATDDEVVDLLADQKIVAVFGGGSESGRRALGNRSILADPRSEDMKDIINHKVKHRQWFRPFAPSILREETSNWFTEDKDSPYMSFVLMFKEEQKSKVPAVVHFNGSARLQTVTENDNKWYYNFIKKWHVKSGVPILLNTSFNDREPICETPEHAINCFLGTEIDYLYFHEKGILLERRKD
jgi:carbamoyltransferase